MKNTTCEAAKEMWDKLEVTHEWTSKVKKDRIISLVNEYELFKMTDDENVESMFPRFSKIVHELRSLEMVYSNFIQVTELVRSLFEAWETKITILEYGDLQNITYDEL